MLLSSIIALFIWLIIRLIQLIFSAGTVFFSYKKSVNGVFQPAYNSSRTAPISRFSRHGFTAWAGGGFVSVFFSATMVSVR
jgi:hypothetical protein